MEIEKLQSLLSDKPLFVFALESEAANEFENANCLFVGIGKINATFNLLKKVIDNKPSIIVNLGTAGSSKHKGGEVVCCTRFIQRDMDVTPLGFQLYETPFAAQPIIMEYGISWPGLSQETCGTGDNFELEHTTNAYDVVDMEAFALAWVAKQLDIPFLCLKYISDGANSEAANDWEVAVHLAAIALKKQLNRYINI
jgi:adenosylhomocysteine nucleosidase